MSKVLLTGGLCELGTQIAIRLLRKGIEVVIVDNLSNSSIVALEAITEAAKKRPAFENIDCMDYMQMDKLFEAHPDINAVIHLAIKRDCAPDAPRPLLDYRNNMNTLLNLLELLPAHHVGQLVLAPFGRTQRVTEHMIQDALQVYPNLQVAILPFLESEDLAELHVQAVVQYIEANYC